MCSAKKRDGLRIRSRRIACSQRTAHATPLTVIVPPKVFAPESSSCPLPVPPTPLLVRHPKPLTTPVIAAIFGSPNFGNLSFTIHGSHFAYGDFLNNLFTFLTVAAAMFFLVVTPINWLMSRRAEEDPETKQCPECDTSIPIKARRCPQCTTRLSGGPDAPARPGKVAAP